ncbi:MAG: STAS-like domain-containing protein [Acidobacteria bacterium]|nr:STAS-like domain-containing protein [Acidobacteriota bacterium]
MEDDLEALRMAIKPQVSGTFGKLNPYTGKNNAGVGLYLSTNIVQKLHADMHLVSGNGLLHISPRDITGRQMSSKWPGTFVLVTLKLSHKKMPVNLHQMLSQARETATKEIASREGKELAERYVLSVENFFGKFAENKEGAINIRDRKLLPALESGKDLLLDFSNVETAPHSFLSALIATPVKKIGMVAYKRIKITNATPEIRETIDYIFDENTT